MSVQHKNGSQDGDAGSDGGWSREGPAVSTPMVEGSLTRTACGMTPVFANVTYRHEWGAPGHAPGRVLGRTLWDTSLLRA